MSPDVAAKSEAAKPHRFLTGYYDDGLGNRLFVPTKNMWLLHEANKPATVLNRAGLPQSLWYKWKSEFQDQQTWVLPWLYWSERPPKGTQVVHASGRTTIKRGPKPDEFFATAEMATFRNYSSRGSAVKAVNAVGVSEKYVRRWLDQYKHLGWFEGWLLRGENPDGIYVATVAQIQRCESAWAYPRLLSQLGIKQLTYQTWLSSAFPQDQRAEWIDWLYGSGAPAGWFVVPEKVEALRNRMSPAGIGKAAGIESWVNWNYDPQRQKALAAAVKAVRQSRKPENTEAWQTLYGDIDPKDWKTRRMAERMLQYAGASTLAAALKDIGMIQQTWEHYQKEAAKVGGEPLKEALRRYVLLDHGRGMNKCGVVREGLFAPSIAMWRFRELANRQRTAKGINLGELRRQFPGRCFLLFQADALTPRTQGELSGRGVPMERKTPVEVPSLSAAEIPAANGVTEPRKRAGGRKPKYPFLRKILVDYPDATDAEVRTLYFKYNQISEAEAKEAGRPAIPTRRKIQRARIDVNRGK